MRVCGKTVVLLVCSLLVGCQDEMARDQTGGNLDMELVKTLNNVQVENAIIAQHTLYPYHFGTDGEMLNDLGRHDLAVLARHFREHPGILNIRQAQTPVELYKVRVAQVLSRLKEAGIETTRMEVADGMPGGSGMPAEQVVMILAEPRGGRTAMTSTYQETITR